MPELLPACKIVIDSSLKIQKYFYPDLTWSIQFIKDGSEISIGWIGIIGGEYEQFAINKTFHLAIIYKGKKIVAEFSTALWPTLNLGSDVIFVQLQVLSSELSLTEVEFQNLFAWKYDFDSNSFEPKRIEQHLGKLTKISDNVYGINSSGLLFVIQDTHRSDKLRCYSRFGFPISKQLREKIVLAFPN